MIVGVSDHGGWAILVTVDSDGTLLDRRRVELVDDALPALPHHHEGQMMPPDRAVALVERVRTSAHEHATRALGELAKGFPDIRTIALRNRQPLPPTIEERIRDTRARNVADWIMYRETLATAAENRGWRVYWFDPKLVDAAGLGDMRKAVGAPWNADHRLAYAAAISALRD